MHHTIQKMAEAFQSSSHHKELAHEVVTAMARDNLSYAQSLERVEHMLIIMECVEKMIMHSYKHKMKSDATKIDITHLNAWER